MIWRCPYCRHEVTLEPGCMMIEDYYGSRIVHEECYQQSGEDEGYVERLHGRLDDEGFQGLFSVNGQ